MSTLSPMVLASWLNVPSISIGYMTRTGALRNLQNGSLSRMVRCYVKLLLRAGRSFFVGLDLWRDFGCWISGFVIRAGNTSANISLAAGTMVAKSYEPSTLPLMKSPAMSICCSGVEFIASTAICFRMIPELMESVNRMSDTTSDPSAVSMVFPEKCASIVAESV